MVRAHRFGGGLQPMSGLCDSAPVVLAGVVSAALVAVVRATMFLHVVFERSCRAEMCVANVAAERF
jgi:hypothetical protein